MHGRTLTSLIVPLALAACAEAPTSPRAAVDGDPAAASVLSGVPDARMADLSVALADARSRLLPALGERQAELQATIQRLDERLAAEDANGVAEASAQVEAALAALPAGQLEAMMAELDALRLTLQEVRVTAGLAPAPAAGAQEQ
ncbi:MAG TPA: hypothetical protein VF006_31305 [Longimicrobium sp.]